MRRHPDALLSELEDGSGVVVHLQRRRYHPLSKSGVHLWHAFDGGVDVDVDGLVVRLTQRYAIDEATARRDVVAFVDQLTRAEILL